MNEATKGNAYYGDGNTVDKNGNNHRKSLYNPEVEVLENNYMNNSYVNNPNKVLLQQYNSSEDINNIIKNFRKKQE